MLEALRESVCRANRMLPAYGLVCLTWGNVSAADREQGVMLIKPSGLSYDEMRPEDIVTVDFETGQAMEGARRPSVDTWIHLEVYRAFPQIRSIVHTHSRWATIWDGDPRPGHHPRGRIFGGYPVHPGHASGGDPDRV